MKCSIKRRNLPPAPKPTRPIIVKEVQGISHHLEVRPEKPAVVPGAKKKRRTPTEAIMESAQKRAEAKRQRKAEAIRLWESGMGIHEIAENMGVKPGSVYGYTRELRTKHSYQYKYLQYDDDVIRMYKEGRTYDQIAETTGLNRGQVNTVIARLRDAGKIGRRLRWAHRKRL